jgi:hypothetical protein
MISLVIIWRGYGKSKPKMYVEKVEAHFHLVAEYQVVGYLGNPLHSWVATGMTSGARNISSIAFWAADGSFHRQQMNTE